MFSRKDSKRLSSAVVLMCFFVTLTANAANGVFTASIDSQGKVMVQSPQWIKNVKHIPQAGYFSDYEIVLNAGVFERNPGFCSVSVTDLDSYDDIVSAHAKLAGTPTSHAVKVITQLIGDSAKEAGTSKSFMLMCVS
ncbi:hypothetical protein [Pseudomonas sp. NPDC086251]|jgi:hypothetical protein|uniref:hypothetical protein n=1 Tax=Pseudomonas sp. NPDC086251 TaxID=3364431 RepID=UPI003833EE4D